MYRRRPSTGFFDVSGTVPPAPPAMERTSVAALAQGSSYASASAQQVDDENHQGHDQ